MMLAVFGRFHSSLLKGEGEQEIELQVFPHASSPLSL